MASRNRLAGDGLHAGRAARRDPHHRDPRCGRDLPVRRPKGKGADAVAKTNAANLRIALTSCYVQSSDFSKCQTAAQLPGDNLPWGAGPGQAQVIWQPFGVNAVASVASASNGDLFGILETLPDHTVSRVCQVPENTYPTRGCESGGAFAANGYGTW